MSPRNGQNPSVAVPHPPTKLLPAEIDDCDRQAPLCAHAVEARQQTILEVRHELRTPLAALRSFLELATDKELDPAVVRECLEAIDRNVLRLSEALDRISLGDVQATIAPFRADPTHLSHRSSAD